MNRTAQVYFNKTKALHQAVQRRDRAEREGRTEYARQMDATIDRLNYEVLDLENRNS